MTAGGETCEDRYGPVMRRVLRAKRSISWACKQTFGIPANILVETRWRLGDEIMAIPIYEGLRREYPSARVTAWCNFPDLLIGNPFINAVCPGNEDVHGIHCDRHILLRGAPRDVFRLDHYAACAGIPAPPSVPQLYYEDWHAPVVNEARGNLREFIAVCTGASWPTKRWPIPHWQTLCRHLERTGNGIVQIGKDDESIGVGFSLLDRTSIRETACVLRAAELLVCCDSGLMHLALAVGTPVVALFGPTVATILIRDGVPCTVLTNGRPCQGCWNLSQQMSEPGVCPLNIPSCMEPLAADTVLSFVREVASRDR
jgi:ADP-heptose:LPS heptosyltransferase